MKRFVALALFLVFLGGESGFPLMDAALEHRASTHEEGRVHIEAAGNPLCHAESCILGLAAAGSRQVTGVTAPSLTVVISVVPGTPEIQHSPPRPVAKGIHLSRAPPEFS
ncbi:MAG: hypothetical protein ACREL6_02765 [Gemmatimonadales bacterium]